MPAAPDYTRALQQLLPPGEALSHEDSSFLTALIDTLAQEFARVEAVGINMLDELDPSTTLALLPDWERIVGLPDACSGVLATTIPERRAAVLAQITAIGGQSRAARIQRAADLGYTITIDNFRPLRAGFRAGDHCASTNWAFAWRVNVLAPASIPGGGAVPTSSIDLVFRAGSARAGDRLLGFATTSLACVFQRERHAHTTLIFAYPPAPVAVWGYDFTKG